MATNTGFGFDIGLKPIDRTSTQYRDQQIDSQSQLPMMSVEPRMSQIPKANINTNRVRETSQVPMQSTNLGEAFGYIDRNEPDNINYKISDTDDKLAQLRSNMFNIGLSFGFDKQAINPIINKPEFVEGFKEELKNMPFNKKVEYNRAKFGFDTQDMTGPEIAKYISDKKELANAQKGAMYDLSSGIDDNKFDEVYGDISDKKEALKGAIYDLPNIKSPKQFAELYPELDKSIYYSYQYDKLSGKKELVPYSNYRVKGKSIDELDPNFGMFQIAARVVNLAPALYNVAAFVTNAALDGDKFSEMMTSLPEGLDYVVGESLKKAQDKEGLGKVMSVMDDLAVFFQENPDIILPQQIPGAIDDIVMAGSKGATKISTSTLVKDAIKYSKEAGKFTLGLADEAPTFGTKVDNILPKTADDLTKDMINVNKDMSKDISKAIKPTVIEKKGSQAIADFEKNVVSSIDTILDNKDAIKYLDDLGDEITKASPETMREFADAIRQAKKIVYEDYAADATKAGEVGAVVNTQPIIDELTILRDRLSKQIGQQNTIDYIDKTILDIQSKPTLDIMTAQDNVQTFNNQLQAFYRNPNYNDVGRTVVDALVNNILRDKLDLAIETALDSPKYMAKKQRYGALKNIEKEVSKRAVVSERANTRGLIDFTDFVSADMAINGIVRTIGGDVVGGIGSIARGYSLNFIKNLYKKWNSPDYNLQKLIKKVQKAKQEGTLYSNKIDNANINSNPVSDIVTLENQKGLVEGQGLKAFKGEGIGGKVNTPGGEGTEFYTSSYDRALSYSKDGKVKEIELNFKPEEIKEIDSKGIKWNTKVDKDGNVIKGLSNKGESNYIDYNNNKAKQEGYKAVVYKDISDTGPYNLGKLKSLDGDDIVLLK